MEEMRPGRGRRSAALTSGARCQDDVDAVPVACFPNHLSGLDHCVSPAHHTAGRGQISMSSTWAMSAGAVG